MNYRNRSVRCPHKMCLETVGCELCGVKPRPRAGFHLRRASERRLSNPPVDPTYKHMGRHGTTGNTNARSKY